MSSPFERDPVDGSPWPGGDSDPFPGPLSAPGEGRRRQRERSEPEPSLPEGDPRYGREPGYGPDRSVGTDYAAGRDVGYEADYAAGHDLDYGTGNGYDPGPGYDQHEGYDPGSGYDQHEGYDQGHGYSRDYGAGQDPDPEYDPEPFPAGVDHEPAARPSGRRGLADDPSPFDDSPGDSPFPGADPDGAAIEGAAVERVAVVPDPVRAGPPGRRQERRGGRNLPVAIGVGLLLGGLVVGTLFVRKEAFVVLAAATSVVAVWELANAYRARRIRVPVVPSVVGAVAMLASAFVAGPEALFVSLALTCLAILLWRVLDGGNPVRDVTAGVFTAVYVPYLTGFAILMLAADDGASRVLSFMVVVIASDVGGYAAGSLYGRHHLAPSVSPNKSWEGLAGSFVLAVAVGVLAVSLLLDGAWYVGVLLGGATVVTATIGDLSESLLKRDLGIKDMGSLLPGHGGVMDRVDSLLPTAPVAYLLLALLVPVS